MSEAAAAGSISRLFSDDRLTRRAAGGDERAFAAIFRRYHQPLYRFCLALVGNPEDAQDALQNTMVKVLRALPGEKRRIELKPWLYRIARNESVDLLRRRRETRQLDVEHAAPGGLAEDAATRERLRLLLADLAELPERQREALVMRELGGLDSAEIGSALGTSGAVARQTLYEARQSLRQMEEGREMNCDAVIRAHLRTCASCRGFRDEIKGRERDLAALAPLPALAAAGMLKGLAGGGHASGGLAASLGGGAAKTIAASSLAKGVATAAVVAAIGVTAADRTGVVHLGLPGDRGAKSSDSSGAAPAVQAPPAQPGADEAGGSVSGDGIGMHSGRAGAAAAGPGLAGRHRGRGQTGGKGSANAQGYGPGSTHPHGRGHEKQHPPGASHGQETAAQNKSLEPGSGGDGAGKSAQQLPPAHPTHPTHPAHPTHSSPPASAPKESSPPIEAPEGATPDQPPVASESPGPPPGQRRR
jgi:RNA polymerase sigma factor (sigma-70 family)